MYQVFFNIYKYIKNKKNEFIFQILLKEHKTTVDRKNDVNIDCNKYCLRDFFSKTLQNVQFWQLICKNIYFRHISVVTLIMKALYSKGLTKLKIIY